MGYYISFLPRLVMKYSNRDNNYHVYRPRIDYFFIFRILWHITTTYQEGASVVCIHHYKASPGQKYISWFAIVTRSGENSAYFAILICPPRSGNVLPIGEYCKTIKVIRDLYAAKMICTYNYSYVLHYNSHGTAYNCN